PTPGLLLEIVLVAETVLFVESAMSLDGILALEVSETSYTTETFNMFVSRLLTRMNPFPLPNSVLVIDNASIHKSQALRMMVERR
ncbi:uncharacterized protein STEHIDRAFT_48598, partial [Stereum hirsutum FP-91666 SS1]|uniref:uncharacterized protein n=1 Tax=Stereum hirsutum (strain FP-91666) TaxID=721885 RepID=UPI000440D31D